MEVLDIDIDKHIDEMPSPYDMNHPEFRLNNDNNKLNCYANAILQVLWNVTALKESIELYARIKPSEKNSKEYRIMDCILVSTFCL